MGSAVCERANCAQGERGFMDAAVTHLCNIMFHLLMYNRVGIWQYWMDDISKNVFIDGQNDLIPNDK